MQPKGMPLVPQDLLERIGFTRCQSEQGLDIIRMIGEKLPDACEVINAPCRLPGARCWAAILEG